MSKIPKSKSAVKGYSSPVDIEKEIAERQAGKKIKNTWTIHPSEKQWRKDMAGLNPVQRCILIDLNFYNRTNGKCWPSMLLISENLNISYKTIKRNMPVLLKKKFVKALFRPGQSKIYKLQIKF